MQYDIRLPACDSPLVILDIGAHVGVFSLMCRQLSPTAQIHAYEPQPDIFEMLEDNTAGAGVICHHLAVGDPDLPRLYRGDKALCVSQYLIGRQKPDETIGIAVLHPSALPAADLVKIDTEGAEVFIVEHLRRLPRTLIVEWHNDELRYQVEMALAGQMRLASCRVLRSGWGVNTYLRE